MIKNLWDVVSQILDQYDTMEAWSHLAVDTQNWHDSDFLHDLDKLVRLLVQTGHTGQKKFVKSSIGLHHCIDIVETIEMHIWNVQFGVRMRKLCLPEDLNPGQTGPETGPKHPIRVRSCILTQDLLGFRLLKGTDHPIL